MESKWVYLMVGFGIGWITKIPFLIKWYRELKITRDYQKAMWEKRKAEILKTLKQHE